MNGTYTQRRRAQMAGGGIASLNMPRKHYLFGKFGDWVGDVKDKIVDDLIPNEIKESPVGAALVGGALLNQFGIPFTGTAGDRMGQNWVGELLGNIPGTGGTIDMVLGGPGQHGQTLGSGITNILTGAKDWFTGGIAPQGRNMLGDLDPNNVTGWMEKGLTMSPTEFFKDYVSSKLPGSNQQQQQTTGTGKYPVRWMEPLGIGAAIGAADYLTRSDDTMPAQLAIDPSRFATAEAAMADPNLRFKPQAQYANVAEGGRIGYSLGKGVTPSKPKTSSKEKLKIILENLQKGLPSLENIKKNIPSEILEGPGMQEGGLMNLGGMEKDYRQEGGFVPIGGAEKADDVPARLSKNEFVFTADAVRAAGGGDIDEGAAVMERLMDNLEAGGKVSEESQGLEGAQAMFANAQQLEKRII